MKQGPSTPYFLSGEGRWSFSPSSSTATPVVLRHNVVEALVGADIVMMPEILLREDRARGTLVPILPDWAPTSRGIHLVDLAERRPTAKLRNVFEFALRAFD